MSTAALLLADLAELARRWAGPIGPLSPLPDLASMKSDSDAPRRLVAAGVLHEGGGVADAWYGAFATLADPVAIVEIDGASPDLTGRVAVYGGAAPVTLVCGREGALLLDGAGGIEADELVADVLGTASVDAPVRTTVPRPVAAAMAAVAGLDLADVVGDASDVALDEGAQRLAASLGHQFGGATARMRLRAVAREGEGVVGITALCIPGPASVLFVEAEDGGIGIEVTAAGAVRARVAAAIARLAGDGDGLQPPTAAPDGPPRSPARPRRRVVPRIRRAVSVVGMLAGLLSSGAGFYRLATGADEQRPTVVAIEGVSDAEGGGAVVPSTTTTIATTVAAAPPIGDGDAATLTCTNDVWGWRAEYPSGWYVGEGSAPDVSCSYFDEAPLAAEDLTADVLPAAAVRIYPAGQSYDETLADARGADGLELADEVAVDVAGTEAIRFEGTADAGRVVFYVFTVHGTAFWADVWEDEADDFESASFVLDTLMTTLRAL